MLYGCVEYEKRCVSTEEGTILVLVELSMVFTIGKARQDWIGGEAPGHFIQGPKRDVMSNMNLSESKKRIVRLYVSTLY